MTSGKVTLKSEVTNLKEVTGKEITLLFLMSRNASVHYRLGHSRTNYTVHWAYTEWSAQSPM